jgi:hypothetical protein
LHEVLVDRTGSRGHRLAAGNAIEASEHGVQVRLSNPWSLYVSCGSVADSPKKPEDGADNDRYRNRQDRQEIRDAEHGALQQDS